jgi:ligand-binding sensor domain-containing protein/signal transduction histidine kinase
LIEEVSNHRCRRACLLVWLAVSSTLAFGLDPQKELRQYGQRSWQTDSGLPQNTVHALLQTRDGYIWLATEAGLVRFDGVQFVTYDKQAPAHLRSATINSLFEDGNGDLWIGTDDCLVRRRGSQFTTFGDGDGLPSNTIWSVFADHTGSLWVVTPDGLARQRQGHFEPFPIAAGIVDGKSIVESTDGSFWVGTHAGLVHFINGRIEAAPRLPNQEVQAVAVTSEGRVWAGTRTGLYSFAPGRPTDPEPLPGLPSNEIAALLPAKDGRLWIGTARGVAVYEARREIKSYTRSDGLPTDRVESFYGDREGAIWIAGSRGVARIQSGRVEAFSARDGLAGQHVLAMYEDREGSLWMGTESDGLNMLHDQKFTAYTTAEGLSDDSVRSVIQDRGGAIWVGTNGGGLSRLGPGRPGQSTSATLTTAKGLSSNIVLALASDASEDLWVGTPDGLDRVRNGQVAAFTSADGLADDFVRSLYPASDGSMWIGTRRGLSHLQNGRFTTYSSTDGLGSDLVGAIVEDRVHRLWIATLGGLSSFEHGKFTTLTMRDGLSSNIITALYADPDGALWIGTSQGGLNRLRDGRITAYPPEATRLPESVYGILEDAHGNLWLGSKTGVYSVSVQSLNDFADRNSSAVASIAYGTADGMRIDECSSGGHPAAWKLANGQMWFATLKGIAAVDPEHLSKNTLPPPVAIEQILVDDQPMDTSGTLTVPPGRGHFEFHYAGLSFIAPQKVGFRYRLEGFDHDWVDAGARRTAYYTNLPPGRYRFRVLACNNDGVWNETGASVDLRLSPRFYQTYWFYTLLLLSLAMMAYLVYRWRLRQAELRFAAVLSERGRIAREIHDTLAQGLVGISVHLELVNRLLASSVESARAQLDQARSLVRDSLTEARSSIWDLRSQAGGTEDLATRLSRMAAAATERSSPRIRVKSKVSGTYRPLPPKAEAELLRIAQEAVANAVRHARPAQISIELRFGARELQMTIQDDGCGFDGQPHPQSSGPEGHFGLAGMRERAAGIGGTMTVESAPGKGTQVSVNVTIAT